MMEREDAEKMYSWLVDLETTLNSTEGSRALESYLVHRDSLPFLEFIWACDGMKNLVEENPSKADDLVTCIYKNYIISGSLSILSNQVVISIAKQFEAHFERPEPSDFQQASDKMEPEPLDLSIFDNAKKEVEDHLQNQIFPEFQKAVRNGEVYVGASCSTTTENGARNGGQAAPSSLTSSRLASQPEAFAKKLCEKLEDLMRVREKKPH